MEYSLAALLELLQNLPDKKKERPVKFKAILWFTQSWLLWKAFEDSNDSNKISLK